MQLKSLSPELFVTGQLTADDIAPIAAQGIRSLIANRPDGEEAAQPNLADIEQAATSAGLVFKAIPFATGHQTADDVQDFEQALAELPKPILTFCRSGMRSTQIWAITQANSKPIDELIHSAAAAGYDIERLRPMLQAISDKQR